MGNLMTPGKTNSKKIIDKHLPFLKLTVHTCQEAGPQKESSLQKPSIFRCEVLVSGRVPPWMRLNRIYLECEPTYDISHGVITALNKHCKGNQVSSLPTILHPCLPSGQLTWQYSPMFNTPGFGSVFPIAMLLGCPWYLVNGLQPEYVGCFRPLNR